jgi:TonB family protein
MKQQTGRTTRCSAGTFEGGLVGLEGRDSRGAEGAVGGLAPRYGLKFYLSGRRVHNSKVVRPPELIFMPRVRCTVGTLAITPATVRMLVETDGRVGHAYIRNSSSNRRFDRCALRHTNQMRFKPGTDKDGLPLNVWIHVRVEPSSLTVTAGL